MTTSGPKKPRVSAGPGRLIVISGPSGVGKDTVLRDLFRLDPSLHYSVSYTTRPPRPGEVNDRSYSFVDEPTFAEMADRKEFLEWAEVHGYHYGTSVMRVEEALARAEDIVLKLDVQGAAYVRRRSSGDAIFIFLLPPSIDELRRRLRDRETESEEQLERRIADSLVELAQAEKYDHLIVNDEVEHAAREIVNLVEESRRHQRDING